MSERILRVRARNAGKQFVVHHGQLTAAYLVQRVLGGAQDRTEHFHALRDISFDIYSGEMVGIIGNNGAGKSTLLRLIGGILQPSSGSVEVNGHMTLLSGLGIGMLPDLTVRENVYLYGAICRMHSDKVRTVFDEIISWAELENFVNTPLRNLSTGMHSRLSFSVAMHVDTPIVLLDEALSAGDVRFKHRCESFFRSKAQGPAAYIIASHSLEFVREFCSKTLWLRSGEQVAFGDTSEVCSAYEQWAG